MALTAQLAHLIAETTYAQLPASAVTQAKRALLSHAGVLWSIGASSWSAL
jgi:hypothetical protein